MAEQKAEIDKDKRRLSILYDSVKYFQKKMEVNMKELESVIEDSIAGRHTQIEDWQREMNCLCSEYDDNAYLNV